MDAVVTSVIGVAPQLGVGSVLLVIVTLLMRRESQDRSDHRTQIAEMASRHTEEMKRVNTAHDEELAELRAEIAALRKQVDELNQKLDEERARRRAAEDAMGRRPRREDPR